MIGAVDPGDAGMHHPAMSTLAERWKQARLSADLGMNALDRKIDQGSGYTSRVERGEKLNPTAVILSKAAKIMGVRSDWLATGEGEAGRDLPPLPSTTSDRRLAHKQQVRRLAVKRGVSDEVLVMYDLEPLEPDDVGDPDYWWQRIKALEAFATRTAPERSATFDLAPPKHSTAAEVPKRKRTTK